jgi:hypothetical protein
MDDADTDRLRDLRVRIDAEEEFNPTLLARYQALEARAAAAGNLLSHPHIYLIIQLLFNEPLFVPLFFILLACTI